MAVDAAPRDEREAGRVRLGVDETPPSFRRVRDPRAATMASRRDLLEEVSRASARVGAHMASDATGLELVALVVVCGFCVVLQALMARRGAVKHGAGDHVAFQRLRRRYNAVYALGTFGDWIQGAYLYALYREHGFEMADIGYIFVLGYFTSATLGTYVASLGDEHGHRKLVMLYGVSYGIACVAMRWSNLAVLLVSRVLSGVAYSLLFSSFESWAITEADRVRVDRRYLVQLFSAATFFNAVSAVAAGIAGNAVVVAPDAQTTPLGGNRYAPAFDVGAVSLFACALGARTWWAEAGQKGGAEAEAEAREGGSRDVSQTSPPAEQKSEGVFRAAKMVLAEPALLSLGSMNSLYEAALHVFVFVWTPALERRRDLALAGLGAGQPKPEVPHGLVFSLFMACKMAGSQVFALIGDRVPFERTLRLVFTGSAVAFAVPLLASPNGYVAALFSFCAFEFGLGLYWPAMAVARAELVPNHLRATMTSVFRVPLNVLVMACLAFAGNADEPSFLMMCFSLMSFCLLFAGRKPRAAAEKTVQAAVAPGV